MVPGAGIADCVGTIHVVNHSFVGNTPHAGLIGVDWLSVVGNTGSGALIYGVGAIHGADQSHLGIIQQCGTTCGADQF